MGALRVTGLPPTTTQLKVLRSAWATADLLQLTTAESTGTNRAVEIAGIGKRELPAEPIAALRSDSIQGRSGMGRTIQLYDNANQLLGEVAIDQGAGARILDTFKVTAGASRGHAAKAKDGIVDLVLTRVNAPPATVPITVVPGRSIVFNVNGVRWIFTCRGATMDKNLSFDYTLFRE